MNRRFLKFATSLLTLAVLPQAMFVYAEGLPTSGLSTAVKNESISPCREPATASKGEKSKMIWIAGGKFLFGNDSAYREEASAQERAVDGFWISAFEVTNREFGEFVHATQHVTVAETYLDESNYPDVPDEQRMPGSVVFVSPTDKNGSLTSWWQFIPGANWRHPEGPSSSIEGKADHPVVHIAYKDAFAYAKWKGHSLPTELQWEFAAKGNFDNTVYAWGNSFTVDGKHQANTWQGFFPVSNSRGDGYVGRAPVGCFPPNSNGLYDMIGNVWEWTASRYYPGHQLENSGNNAEQNGFDPKQPNVAVKVLKGGSFLCAPNACRRYRPSARHAQDISLGASHIGFRTVINAP